VVTSEDKAKAERIIVVQIIESGRHTDAPEEYDNGPDHDDQVCPREAEYNTQKILDRAHAASPGRRFAHEPRSDHSSRHLEERKKESPDDGENYNGEHDAATINATI
jgi:hypothetical protein